MSSIKLTADSGGGTFELKAPSSSGNTRVLTVPDTASGTVLTTTNPKAGNIIQVVSASTQTGASQNFSAGSTFADTGLSASITPTATSSKIFVTGYISWYISSSANGSKEWNFAVCDGSNNILDSTNADTQGYRVNELYNNGGKHPINFLHSPSTTSSFTYKIRMNAHTSNNNSTSLVCQRNGTANNTSRIILMEVAG
tara:strand:- start:293 stop:886 length:594 start_codon:yes stop_codon:yes gene_type:complete